MTTDAGERPSIASLLTTEIRFGRADLRVETNRGEGAAEIASILARIERRAELDVVAIADRDQLESSLEARGIVAREGYGFEVVTGVLVTSSDGPLLGLWLESPVAPGQPADDTIRAIHEGGGVAVIPHPFARWRQSLGRRVLEQLLESDDRAARPDAIQLTSGSARADSGSDQALERNASSYHLAEVGASDAVFEERVATAYTLFPGRLRPGERALELRRAIEMGTTRATRGERTPLRRLGWRRVAEQRTRELRFASARRLSPLIERLSSGGSR
jgi:predicted metal-dependent phosphoesterase TrpH